MCGRYTLRTAPADHWPAAQLDLFVPRYNIAPSQEVPVVRSRDSGRQLVMLRWGLVPSWAKIGYRMINARAETLAEKPSFRNAFKQRRCLILADGYYEWKANGKQKQPFFIHRPDNRPFAFAGLWESWRGPKDERLEKPLETCTIITTDSNELTSDIHDRMPVILQNEELEFWLDPQFQGRETLEAMLTPFPSDELTMYPVSTFVNKPINESEECVTPQKKL
jgi:putative SOS response-associated peptidase YedK